MHTTSLNGNVLVAENGVHELADPAISRPLMVQPLPEAPHPAICPDFIPLCRPNSVPDGTRQHLYNRTKRKRENSSLGHRGGGTSATSPVSVSVSAIPASDNPASDRTKVSQCPSAENIKKDTEVKTVVDGAPWILPSRKYAKGVIG